MPRLLALTALTLLLLSANKTHPQDTFPVLTDPDAIAGIWQTADTHGGTLGINIELSTAIDGLPTTFTGASQRIISFQVQAFHSATPVPARSDFYAFTVLATGETDWDGHRLRVHFAGDTDRLPTDIDLLWRPQAHTWTGTFQVGDLRRQVTLHRPAARRPQSPFAGTWATRRGMNCLHLAEVADNQFVAWFDQLQLTGLERRRAGLPAPPYALQHYGEIAIATEPAPDQITIELHPTMSYTGGIVGSGPRTFTAKLSPDKQALLESWRAGPNQTPAALWHKQPGNSCRGSVPSTAP